MNITYIICQKRLSINVLYPDVRETIFYNQPHYF